MGALERSATPAPAPYLRIAAELRDRITSGELRAGEKVPSTRQITQEWGVAMATATKVLAVLRREGLVRAVPGVGTVVESPGGRAGPLARAPRRNSAREGENALTRERVVRTAIGIADAEGAAALSMRAIAAELGVSTMALYRYVPGKDELVVLMADAAFGEDELPADAPEGWRERLEAAARLQWALYRRHPWLAKAMSFTRPLLSPNALAHMEWAMAPVERLGLDPQAMLHITVTVAGYVRGVAVNLEDEAEAEQDTGITNDQWLEAQYPAMVEIVESGRYAMYGRIMRDPGVDLTLDSMFEFGLLRLLDGLGAHIARRRPGP
ncbi:TetR/AcrR family transcriptional regulator C-terminal domain-containing protein [Streptomyces sp. ISL-11]|uniref:TetR/AcrR family transcriptional regulator C-terminal domain-containing protein n=1 Tax=Streptomyces sp. ISL-11 TaxID=2819174 RepID=UPI001BE7343C|nr:TetR/AcrR family transcriptional regulator C-terminal domain-containing protein [Streptomyces sp. ISL-11]MBT2385339.1 TetR/AcrR family transcriptional regulator C-terminal domain-containing protein [Streptomyces sp. ISL-11]